MPWMDYTPGQMKLVASRRAKKNREFESERVSQETFGSGRKNPQRSQEEGHISSRGDPADSVFYIQKGKVRLSVVSKTGKEATIGILGESYFFGEGALAGQLLRMGSAAAMTDCEILHIDKNLMIETLHRDHGFSGMFVAYLLARNIRYEEDLVDQLFNSSEKRLARVLLLLARFGKKAFRKSVVPKISQETLAEMVETTALAGQLFHVIASGNWALFITPGERKGRCRCTALC